MQVIKETKMQKKVVSAVTSKQLMERAACELTGVSKAAIAAGHRMMAPERDAESIHARTLLSCTARVTSTKGGGVHALLTDAFGTTLEISGGEVCAAVAPSSNS
jgi:hypothetical protein